MSLFIAEITYIRFLFMKFSFSSLYFQFYFPNILNFYIILRPFFVLFLFSSLIINASSNLSGQVSHVSVCLEITFGNFSYKICKIFLKCNRESFINFLNSIIYSVKYLKLIFSYNILIINTSFEITLMPKKFLI